MNDFFATLKSKAGPLPIWAWAGLGTVALALFLMRAKTKKSDSTSAAADQANSNLGSASELANMFEVAGLMPYQGGDVYVNTTQTNNPPSGATTTLPPVNSGPPAGSGVATPPVTHIAGPTPTMKGPGTSKSQGSYTVKRNDTLSGIGKKYGFTAAQLFKYNTTKGVRPTSTIATLKQRGMNLLFAGEKILIPPKGYK